MIEGLKEAEEGIGQKRREGGRERDKEEGKGRVGEKLGKKIVTCMTCKKQLPDSRKKMYHRTTLSNWLFKKY